MTKEIELTRADGGAQIVVRGWSNTHVLFDVWDDDTRKWKENFSRPILPFMLDYGLFPQ
jgi:hypothetical protein